MYKKNRHIHFIGIGGIGMSGIAAILRQQGYVVSGCDVAQNTPILMWLQKLGCEIHVGHHEKHVEKADVLVYSSAIDENHDEIKAALEAGIPVIPRAMMLAELMRMRYSIAVAGSHGKTTTTSMLSHILTYAKLDPTIVIGGVLKNLSTHAKLGSGDLLIAEADESDRSFLYLNPSIAIVTNIDAEHLDTYKDLDDVKQTFKDFLARLPFYGKAFVCIDDPNIQSILPSRSLSHVKVIKYGFDMSADLRGEIVDLHPHYSKILVFEKIWGQKKEVKLGEIRLHMPGEHNILNALAAISLSRELDLSFSVIQEALQNFKGVERRFELKGSYAGAEIFDDYGHHPSEIEKTLVVAKRRAKKRLHVVFQPHRYTRTEKLWKEFVRTLAWSGIDTLYLTDIYPASEKPIPGVTSDRLVKEINKANPKLAVFYHETYEQIVIHAAKTLKDGDLFLTLGAGKANCIGKALLEKETKCSR